MLKIRPQYYFFCPWWYLTLTAYSWPSALLIHRLHTEYEPLPTSCLISYSSRMEVVRTGKWCDLGYKWKINANEKKNICMNKWKNGLINKGAFKNNKTLTINLFVFRNFFMYMYLSYFRLLVRKFLVLIPFIFIY